jgi:hypothetical protein
MQLRTKNRWRFNPEALRLRDVLIIVPAVIVLMILAVALGFLFGAENMIRWGGLAVFTALLFGFFIHSSRPRFKDRRFWVLTSFLLIGHLVFFGFLFLRVSEWKLSWFAITIPELLVFLQLRDWL